MGALGHEGLSAIAAVKSIKAKHRISFRLIQVKVVMQTLCASTQFIYHLTN